jgi:hypothetical protein
MKIFPLSATRIRLLSCAGSHLVDSPQHFSIRGREIDSVQVVFVEILKRFNGDKSNLKLSKVWV